MGAAMHPAAQTSGSVATAAIVSSTAALSVKEQFKGRCVFLTGGLGYQGSILLEQLLRLTEVEAVYVLVRGKKTVAAAQRVHDLLRNPLFNQVRTSSTSTGSMPDPFSKVHAVEGDLRQPNLGLSDQHLQVLRSKVHIVLHCAADIRVEPTAQESLRNNYVGTRTLMQLASQMVHLRSFVHVSTFFVNNFRPYNSVCEERIYPLHLEVGGRTVDHREYVAAMLSMDAASADRHTRQLMARHNFTSMYAFGKHLTEQLVDSTVIRPGVSRAIVRPSMICSIAEDPYPGYINSYAAFVCFSLAYAMGFMQDPNWLAWRSDCIMDIIPADTVGHVILATAAAAVAAYQAPGADRSAIVYHATSGQSNPLTVKRAIDILSTFWQANPPELALPGTRYPRFTHEGAHTAPSLDAVQAGKHEATRQLKALAPTASESQLHALQNVHRAFCGLFNSTAVAKSMVSTIDNVRALHSRIVPEERAVWEVVFEEASLPLEEYCYTFLAGVRRLLLHIEGDIQQVRHRFSYKAPVTADASQEAHSQAHVAAATAVAPAKARMMQRSML